MLVNGFGAVHNSWYLVIPALSIAQWFRTETSVSPCFNFVDRWSAVNDLQLKDLRYVVEHVRAVDSSVEFAVSDTIPNGCSLVFLLEEEVRKRSGKAGPVGLSRA
jgi:hypothetical protein